MSRLLRIIRLAAAVLLLTAPVGRAQNTAEQESRRSALKREIAQLERQIKENVSKSSNALNELTLVRRQISARRRLVEESRLEIGRLEDSIAVRTAEAERLRERLATMEQYYRRLIRNAYKNRDARIWYSYLLASKDLGQASRRYNYLRNLSGQMNSQGRKLAAMRAGLEADLVRLDSLKREAEEVKASREQELQGLRREELRSDQLVANLRKDKNLYQRQLETKRRQVEALNREIERIIAQAIEESRKKETPAREERRPADYKLSGEFAANKGRLPWPADGPVVEPFGKHNHPVYTTLVMPANNGVNIGLSRGDAVRAVYDGEVKRIIVMPGYGRCILVQHGGYFTFYCKLGEVSVKSGDKVTTGQTQLHFEVWKEKTPENPELWLREK